ncbi:MAG: IpaD/SipD/SspD family type III secretion system needle tip protein [Pseudomonadales bacterium]|nr:IpaD/SipD/SspD family type III secretion system needle tip protein [Pseudomonadales bacterium]MBH2032444.1 IpaD/SipD/SspD family type III secretion system needle tip protein [Pseudomonadales bacterium]MBH2076538.1 IpaD/SipD/SspD family type III secretion system needle tip protein [Pseudomonadales bacterium]
MRISDFTPPNGRPPEDHNEPMSADAPAQVPSEDQLAPSMTYALDRSLKTMNRLLENMIRCQPDITKVVSELSLGGSAHSAIAEFVEQVEIKRMRSQQWASEIRNLKSAMTDVIGRLTEQQHQQVPHVQNRILRELSSEPTPAEIEEAFDAIINSPNDFFDKLLELIDLIKNGYLAGYEHLIKAYSDFFSDFNKEITAKMKEWIEGANDGKEVKLNAGQMRSALQALIQKYSHPNPASVLFPAPGMDGATREEADNWRKALGLPESCLKRNADGTYSVVMDLGPLTVMLGSLPTSGTWVTWDTAKFQAWQTGFNAQEERLKNMLQSFTQKYSNANSYHDNFNKTLSSHLNQFADMLKAMLNF